MFKKNREFRLYSSKQNNNQINRLIQLERAKVSKSVDFEKIKEQMSVFIGLVRRKFTYLMDCIDRMGMAGVSWWFKTHQQQDKFKIVLQDLRVALAGEQASLLSVEKTFSDFIIPEEDLGHVYWYTDAHNKLEIFEKTLTEKKQFNIKQLQQAMNELKFIGQSDEFHTLYQLEDIQQRIKDMYQELQQKIVEQQSLERQKIETDKNQQVAHLAKADADKVAAVAKVKMMEAVKIKEKRLAIIEEKKRQLVEKETTELRIKEQNEQAEIAAKQAEVERQQKLQESYRELELKEKLKELPLEELIEMVNQQIEHKTILTFIQLDQLSKLKHTIEDKEA